MKIGIDISQLAFPNTGVGNYVYQLVYQLLQVDTKNEYILFFSSLRGKIPSSQLHVLNNTTTCNIKSYKFPPLLLDLLWNKLHIMPIEWLIGDIDVFITSDWTEPPVKRAKKATFIYDMIVYKFPDETDRKIVETQKRKLKWVEKESKAIFTISEATKKDIQEILHIPADKIHVAYPGI